MLRMTNKVEIVRDTLDSLLDPISNKVLMEQLKLARYDIASLRTTFYYTSLIA